MFTNRLIKRLFPKRREKKTTSINIAKSALRINIPYIVYTDMDYSQGQTPRPRVNIVANDIQYGNINTIGWIHGVTPVNTFYASMAITMVKSLNLMYPNSLLTVESQQYGISLRVKRLHLIYYKYAWNDNGYIKAYNPSIPNVMVPFIKNNKFDKATGIFLQYIKKIDFQLLFNNIHISEQFKKNNPELYNKIRNHRRFLEFLCEPASHEDVSKWVEYNLINNRREKEQFRFVPRDTTRRMSVDEYRKLCEKKYRILLTRLKYFEIDIRKDLQQYDFNINNTTIMFKLISNLIAALQNHLVLSSYHNSPGLPYVFLEYLHRCLLKRYITSKQQDFPEKNYQAYNKIIQLYQFDNQIYLYTFKDISYEIYGSLIVHFDEIFTYYTANKYDKDVLGLGIILNNNDNLSFSLNRSNFIMNTFNYHNEVTRTFYSYLTSNASSYFFAPLNYRINRLLNNSTSLTFQRILLLNAMKMFIILTRYDFYFNNDELQSSYPHFKVYNTTINTEYINEFFSNDGNIQKLVDRPRNIYHKLWTTVRDFNDLLKYGKEGKFKNRREYIVYYHFLTFFQYYLVCQCGLFMQYYHYLGGMKEFTSKKISEILLKPKPAKTKTEEIFFENYFKNKNLNEVDPIIQDQFLVMCPPEIRLDDNYVTRMESNQTPQIEPMLNDNINMFDYNHLMYRTIGQKDNDNTKIYQMAYKRIRLAPRSNQPMDMQWPFNTSLYRGLTTLPRNYYQLETNKNEISKTTIPDLQINYYEDQDRTIVMKSIVYMHDELEVLRQYLPTVVDDENEIQFEQDETNPQNYGYARFTPQELKNEDFIKRRRAELKKEREENDLYIRDGFYMKGDGDDYETPLTYEEIEKKICEDSNFEEIIKDKQIQQWAEHHADDLHLNTKTKVGFEQAKTLYNNRTDDEIAQDLEEMHYYPNPLDEIVREIYDKKNELQIKVDLKEQRLYDYYRLDKFNKMYDSISEIMRANFNLGRYIKISGLIEQNEEKIKNLEDEMKSICKDKNTKESVNEVRDSIRDLAIKIRELIEENRALSIEKDEFIEQEPRIRELARRYMDEANQMRQNAPFHFHFFYQSYYRSMYVDLRKVFFNTEKEKKKNLFPLPEYFGYNKEEDKLSPLYHAFKALDKFKEAIQ